MSKPRSILSARRILAAALLLSVVAAACQTPNDSNGQSGETPVTRSTLA